MKFFNQDISKTITASSFKLVQLIGVDYLVKIKKNHFNLFLVIALCKFGHRKLDTLEYL